MQILKTFNPFLIVILMAVLLLAGWLGSRDLAEPDETRFSEISREMALQTDWLIPHLNGVPHFQKPPLTYWITATFIRRFGANEWAVRLTPALAAFGTLLFTMVIAGILYGKTCRWQAGLILVASLLFASLARIITTDMLLTFFITAAVAGLVGYVHLGRKSGLALFYLCMGLGFLTKGPLAILIPSFAGAAIQAGKWRQRKPVSPMYWWLGLPVALLIGLSWYLAILHRDRTMFDYFFRYEFVERFASNTHNRSKPIWFYPAVMVVGFLPWAAFVPVVLRDAWRQRRSLASANGWLFIGWVIVPYIVLSLVVSKLATYLLPLMPPMSILLARWLDHPTTADRWRVSARITAGLLAAILLTLPALTLSPKIRLPQLGDLPIAFWLVMLLVLGSVLILWCALGRNLSLKAFLFWMTGTWICMLLALASQANVLMTGGNRSVRALTQAVNRLDPAGTVPVLAFNCRANGAEFYLRRYVYRGRSWSDVVLPLEGEMIQRIVPNVRVAADALLGHPAFIIVKHKAYLKEVGLQKWQDVLRDGPWQLLASPDVASLNDAPFRHD